MQEGMFIIGNGQIQRVIPQRGEPPPCPQAKFKRGDVVKVSRRQAVAHFPPEAIVAVAIPPGFSADHALADLVGEPRPLMAQVGSRAVTYILVRENDPKPYIAKERDLKATGETVEFGECRRETEAEKQARASQE